MGSQPKYEVGQHLVVVDEKSQCVGMTGIVGSIEPGMNFPGERWMYDLIFDKPKRGVRHELLFEFKVAPIGDPGEAKKMESSLMELLNI